MSAFIRSGRPHHLNGTTAVVPAVEKWPMPGETIQVVISNLHATQALEVFFTTAASAAGAGAGWLINAGMTQEFLVECLEIWTRAAAAVPFRMMVSMRP